jgi:hypothetical protein
MHFVDSGIDGEYTSEYKGDDYRLAQESFDHAVIAGKHVTWYFNIPGGGDQQLIGMPTPRTRVFEDDGQPL